MRGTAADGGAAGFVHPLWASIVLSLFFSAFAVAFILVALAYVRNTLLHRDKFELRVRMPSLMCLEIFQLTVMCVVTSMREVVAAWHLALPCAIQDLSYVIGLGGYYVVWPVRLLQLIVVFDPGMRKLYHSYFKPFKVMLLLGVFVAAMAFYILMQTRPHLGCNKMCGQPGCFWGSRWVTLLVYFALLYPVVYPLIRKMRQLKVKDRIGVVHDIQAVVVWCTLLNFVWVVVVPLVDYEVLPEFPFYTLGSLAFVMSNALALLLGHILPARRWGYAPPRMIPRWRSILKIHASSTFDDAPRLTEVFRDAHRRGGDMERGGSGGSVSVAPVQLNVVELLLCKGTKDMFLKCCREHLCEEPALFLLELFELAKTIVEYGRKSLEVVHALGHLYVEFIKEDSPYSLPLSARTRRYLVADLAPPDPKQRKKKKKKGGSKWGASSMVKLTYTGKLRPIAEGQVDGNKRAAASDAEKVDLHLLAARNEMERLLTTKVLPSFNRDEDYKVMANMMVLGLRQSPTALLEETLALSRKGNVSPIDEEAEGAANEEREKEEEEEGE